MKKKKILIISGVILAIITIGIVSFVSTKDLRVYNQATELMNSKDYDSAIQTFITIQDYKDSTQQINECYYQKALDLVKDKKYSDALKIFREIKDYEKTEDGINECNYEQALDLISSNKYKDAIHILEDLDYKDSDEILIETKYVLACDLLDRKQYLNAIEILKNITYKDSSDKCIKAQYDYAKELISEERYEDATDYLINLNYEDSETLLIDCRYKIGINYYNNLDYENALEYLDGLGYKDSDKIVDSINNNPYSLRKFVERYNSLMFELDEAGQVATSLSEDDFINGRAELFSGGVLTLNNDQGGENYINNVTNFNYMLEDADDYDLLFAMSEMYAIIAAIDPKSNFNTADKILSKLLNEGECSKNGIDYDNYSMSGMILLVGTRK